MTKKVRMNDMADQIILSTAQMKQIARYELTFKEIISGSKFEGGNILCPRVYTFTLDDLYHAIKNMKTADPAVSEFGEYWFYPITQLAEAFDLERAQGYADDESDVPDDMKGFPGLIISESTRFNMLYMGLSSVTPLASPLNSKIEVPSIVQK